MPEEIETRKLLQRMTLRLLEAHADISALKALMVLKCGCTTEELDQLCHRSRVRLGCFDPQLGEANQDTSLD